MTENNKAPLGIGHWPKWKQIVFFVLAVFASLVLIDLAKSVWKSSQESTATTDKVEPSLSAKIAVIDAGQFVPNVETAPETTRIRQALKKASESCRVTEGRIGNASAAVAQTLKEEKLSSQIVDLLEMLPSLVTPDVISDCPKILAHYAATRHSGMNHPDAIIGLRGVIDLTNQLQGKSGAKR